MGEQRTYSVISADGHLETPPDVWVKYVPNAYKERAPRLVKLLEGGEGWLVEGQPLLHNGQNVAGGKRPIKLHNDSYWNPDGTPAPGAGPAEQRLREQDQDGIDAEVLFPPLFASRFLTGIADKKVYLSMIQAYNTWLAQEYCAVAPDRLIGVGVMPVSGIDDAVNELKRCKELGLRTVGFAQFPNGGGRPQPEDDRFWEAALSLGMALSPHVVFGDSEPPRVDISVRSFAGSLKVAVVGNPTYPIIQMIADGVLDRFPELRIYIAETNASWLPSALWFLDDNYEVFKETHGAELKRCPSEYVRRHFRFGIIRDPMALKLRDFLPAENLMWGTDFPHGVCSYPKSREWLEIIFEGVPDALRRKILLENPAEFFGLDLHKPITPTPNA
jgi:predicted TIM-barrel fold metal-dependent hydrolase